MGRLHSGTAAAICLLAGAIQGSVDVALSALQAVAIAFSSTVRARPDQAVHLHPQGAAQRAGHGSGAESGAGARQGDDPPERGPRSPADDRGASCGAQTIPGLAKLMRT